jgi:prepilin-type N-terminal cleavage/methylation domain-containing protein
MKNQKGFTLIELLLVLAIIGIISAIAIPALLGQRARARDKSAQENATGAISDIVAAYDKAKETGVTVAAAANIWAVLTTVVAPLPNALAPQLLTAPNPWSGTNGSPALGYAQAVAALAAPGDPAAARLVVGPAAATVGVVYPSFLPPAPATGVAGVIGCSVFLQGPFTEAGATQHIFVKVANVD